MQPKPATASIIATAKGDHERATRRKSPIWTLTAEAEPERL